MQYENDFYAYVLGALLHDIGKFVQRAQRNPKEMDHCKWGDQWFEENLSEKLKIFDSKEKDIIRRAINTHHDHMDFISLADSLSAGMDRIELKDEEEKDPFSSRLKCIFSQISISKTHNEIFYYPLKSLSENLDEIFPVKEERCSYEEYLNLLKELNEEIGKTLNQGLSALELIDSFYFLLWKFAWAIPSSAYKDEPDISLFDHLKTTAAITACLYLYSKENGVKPTANSPAFILLMGDVSGIQSYIFDVLTQQGKVAKRLRARSFFVQLLSEVASHKIIHKFGLPYLNILSSAGGNFSILLPNLKNATQQIMELQKEFDEWAYKKLGGELFISLAFSPITGNELKDDYSKVIENNLKPALNYRKAQPFSSILKSDDRWNTEKFLMERRIEGEEKACTGCRKFPIKDQAKMLCENCLMDIEVGARLTKARYIAFFKSSNSSSPGFPVLNYYFELWDRKRDSSPYLVLSLNYPSPWGFKYLPNYIPLYEENCKIEGHEHEEGEPLSFECISGFSEGDKLLGIIKGDADNMGKIFREGFKGTKLTISRYCSLSRMLDTFFSGYLNYKIKNNFKELYVVFSGGDDFIIIGPWNRIIDFSKEMREDYSKFAGFNPDLTFSSGIVLAKHHEPVSFLAEIAEEELKKAKQSEGKDSVRIFGKTLKWHELKEALDESKKVINWVKSEPPVISRSLVFNFREYGLLAEKSNICEEGKKIETKYLKFVPLMVYDIERNLSSENQKEAFEWAYSFLPNQKTPYIKKLKLLRVIMEYVLKYTRGGE